MKAAFINQHGGPEVLQYGDLPDPVARPGEVVVDIFAASVNAADWKSRSGDYGQVKFPYVLGRDFSGVVTSRIHRSACCRKFPTAPLSSYKAPKANTFRTTTLRSSATRMHRAWAIGSSIMILIVRSLTTPPTFCTNSFIPMLFRWEEPHRAARKLSCLVSVRKHIESLESVVIQRWWPDSGRSPMWTPQNRKRYDRSRLRYPSDLTNEEWAHVARVIPPAKPGGNKRMVDVREVMNGVMYVLSTGCQWRALPKDLPPKSTVHDYFILWSCDGTLDRIHHALYVACREQAKREASPTAAIIDSQSVKSAERGGLHR